MRAAVGLVILAGCGFTIPAVAGGPHDGAVTADGRPLDAAVAGDAPPAPDAAAAACPASFVAIPAAGTGSRYLAVDKQSQAGALATCAAYNTHLLHLDSQAEANALVVYIDNRFGTGDTGLYRVVGARDRLVTPNVWHDLDLSLLTFLPWGTGEPTSLVGEDCMLLKYQGSTGVIGADQCTTAHEFACECD